MAKRTTVTLEEGVWKALQGHRANLALWKGRNVSISEAVNILLKCELIDLEYEVSEEETEVN